MSTERQRGRRGHAESEPTPQDIERAREHTRLERRALLKGAVGIGGAAAAAAYFSMAPPSWPLSLNDPDGERGKPQAPVRKLPEGGFAVPDRASVADL
ncbi:MAG TPA: twin-arginine translocation signal domain-containing protein, partial [Polyangiaceae bacterium]|nr:twin-arginine translocation signal domain-containing protein [Polyangiaceae bacterium]